jgi:phosphohistidine phosphatase SixA
MEKSAMATREIILLRHAHAEPAVPGQDDIARVLSLRGEAEADAAGAWLKRHAAAPDRVLYSPAARTRETCERVLAALGFADLRSEARIYEATPATLLRVLDDHADANSILLVGHNPGLENLVALMTEGASDSGRGMPPAGIVWMKLPDGPVDPGTAEVRHFWSP